MTEKLHQVPSNRSRSLMAGVKSNYALRLQHFVFGPWIPKASSSSSRSKSSLRRFREHNIDTAEQHHCGQYQLAVAYLLDE